MVVAALLGAIAQADLLVKPIQKVTRLDDIGLYRVGCTYLDGHKVDFPIGWQGDFDDTSGVACRPFGSQNGRNATLLHCPWRGGTGVTIQEYLVALPKGRRAVLSGAIAMGTNCVGKSDGARFRIIMNGRVALDELRKDDAWKPFKIDLPSGEGRPVSVRFETSPGPANDPSFDYSLWGDRQLTVEGLPEQPTIKSSKAPPLASASAMASGEVAPIDGEVGKATVSLTDRTAAFVWKGVVGTFRYQWTPSKSDNDGALGTASLVSNLGTTPLASGARIKWIAEPHLVGSEVARKGDRVTARQTYRVANQIAHLTIAASLVRRSLVFEVTCDKPLIESFDGGSWGPAMFRKQVSVPYYTGQVTYLPAENLFVNSFLDWTQSNASNQDGTSASYFPLTDGARNTLHDRVVFAASEHVVGAFPAIPNKPSPFIRELGGRMVLDIWGGQFRDISNGLTQLADYGIRDGVAIIHDWQRSGYDNALPAHYPAAANYGGEDAMRGLVQTGKWLGYRVALHENYVDYYPNYERFSEADVSLDSSGKRVLAWYQPGTKIQSFAVQPNATLRLAGEQSPEIHKRYETNANYLDVHSAVPPWFHVDYRAGELGAGRFSRVFQAHRDLWAYERTTHGGPVFGEGNTHWFWSGLLDGVEAQFGSGWPWAQGLSAPLMVDFDLMRMHPLIASHGMGYYERWWDNQTWGTLPPISVLDQYRTQEVVYGHAPFLGGAVWNRLPYAWMESNLVSPVAAAYAGQHVANIEYLVAGKWVDADTAAKLGEWQTVRVTYANGLVVIGNCSGSTFGVAGVTLPKHSWAASGAGITAWSGQKAGKWADYVETATSVFANARNAAFWNLSGLTDVTPAAVGFQQVGARRFRIGVHWNVKEAIRGDYRVFMHYSQPNKELADEGIKFQSDFLPSVPTSLWKPGSRHADGPFDVQVPAGLPDGDYRVGVGLWREGESRLPIRGVSDSYGRIQLGVLRVRQNGEVIAFVPELGSDADRLKLYAEHLNPGGPVIDFGTIKTNGSVRVRREGNEWVLQTYPRGASFTLLLSSKRFGLQSVVKASGNNLPVACVDGYWRFKMNGAATYRWEVTLR